MAGRPRCRRNPVAVDEPVVGRRRAARAHAAGVAVPFTFTVAEPGWTVFMISHFHYDPVWWNTQGAYTSVWQPDPPSRCRNGFELVRAHLEMAAASPSTNSCSPKSTTSSPTGTPTPRTAPTCGD
ncbi:alpha-mannosidase domain protein [Mycobacterium xenopi 4042]|uniref:Alpha-mannosidase domain protein n=1 Tax=Mycobacterium xenopi 4042 TaxID=1299334 RepID=X8ED59_MYCXE|nr:alpha-mannosidase domain protein [Mycobacterium xenopi 4042]